MKVHTAVVQMRVRRAGVGDAGIEIADAHAVQALLQRRVQLPPHTLTANAPADINRGFHMTIYSACTGKSFQEIEAEFAGCGYGKFKPAVGEAVVETLRPIREEATRIMKDKAYLEQVYRDGAEKAGYVAEKTLRKVYKKVGFVTR